jgi:hypothetical protein
MSSDDDAKLILFATLGFGAGLYCFFKGFKIFRQYRVLADTPEIPIRSMPMGLVEIHGKAKLVAEKLINSPVTHTPCLFYKVEIEKYQRDSKGNGSWRHYKTDCTGMPFYLDDGTGKVLVNPYEAELDLLRTTRRTTGNFGKLHPHFGRLLSGIGAPSPAAVTPGGLVSDSELIAYAMAAKSSPASGFSLAGSAISLGGFSLNLGSGGSRYRFTEYCILPDHWYDVTGTCTENPSSKDESDRNMITKGRNEPTFVISWRNEKGIEGMLRRRAVKYVLGGAALSVACLAFLLAKFGWL